VARGRAETVWSNSSIGKIVQGWESAWRVPRRAASTRPRLVTRDAIDAIGQRLRRARDERGLSLRALAKEVGLTASLLSQIENGQANPSVDTLFALAEVLAVPVAYFFHSDGDGLRVNRKPSPAVEPAERQRVELAQGVEWESLLPETEAGLEFMVIRYPPGAVSTSTLQRHSGRDYGLVVRGHLTVRLVFAEYVLGPGASISYDATLPHQLCNRGETEMEAVWLRLDKNEFNSP